MNKCSNLLTLTEQSELLIDWMEITYGQVRLLQLFYIISITKCLCVSKANFKKSFFLTKEFFSEFLQPISMFVIIFYSKFNSSE